MADLLATAYAEADLNDLAADVATAAAQKAPGGLAQGLVASGRPRRAKALAVDLAISEN